MKKIVLYILLTCLCWFLGYHWVYANWQNDICSGNDREQTYKCRIENVCNAYKSPKPVYVTQAYLQNNDDEDAKSWTILETAKERYRENMWNIYTCAIIQAQKNSLKNLQGFLKAEAWWELAQNFWWQIEIRQNRLDISANTIWCTLSDRENVQNKLNILKESSHETCKYVNYLAYLDSYYDDVASIYSDEEKQEVYKNIPNIITDIGTQNISSDINRLKNALAEERSHTFQVFPLAYQAYSEYENTFPIHFLLELIEADFIILRQKLYETLMPLAQLGIKMINAMSY